MTHTSFRRVVSFIRLGIASLAMRAAPALAAIYDGPGLVGGLNQASGITGLNTSDPRAAIVNILRAVLNFLALIAVIMIIIAGFYLVLSFGDDEKKDKAKRIIYYTLIGLLVILFARVIVSFVTVWLSSQV
jgi:hypothetical protein